MSNHGWSLFLRQPPTCLCMKIGGLICAHCRVHPIEFLNQKLLSHSETEKGPIGQHSEGVLGMIWGDLETYWSDLGWPGDVLRWSGMIWGRSEVTWDWCKVWHFSWVILLALFLSGVRFGIFLIKEIKGTNVSSDNFLIAVTESICISWALNRLLAFVV